MGKPQRRKGNLARNKTFHKSKKTKNYRRDIDQIHDDNKAENIEKYMNQPINDQLPGFGQFYCISCARHFVNKTAIEGHFKTKDHKKQIKTLKDTPYSIKESEEYGK